MSLPERTGGIALDRHAVADTSVIGPLNTPETFGTKNEAAVGLTTRES